MSLYDPCPCVCRQHLAFDPAVHRTASGKGEMCSFSPYFRLILTFCYCFYEFLREQELGTGRLPDTDKAESFHGQTSWLRFNDCVPDFQDAMELWALRPHAILVKVISVCRVHFFFHQYVADLREERSENVLRTFAASPFILDMTVSSTSGVIAMPPESSAGEVLNTGLNVLHGVNTGSPFVVPPALGRAASPFILDMTVSSTSGVIAMPPESSAGEVLNTGLNVLHGVNTGSPFVVPPALGIERAGDAAPLLSDLLDVGVTPVFFFAQFIGLLFHTHAAAEAGKVFVVFVFAQPFPASARKDIASAG